MGRSTTGKSFGGVLAGAAALVALAVPASAEDVDAQAINFRTPFDCGQVWNANTRADHNPQNAVDFQKSNAQGQNVLASASGEVTKVEDLGDDSYGKYLVIEHTDGWTTLYAHLSAFEASEGDSVSTGDLIGKVGSTGGSTGPHLHYEQIDGGTVQRVVLNGVKIKYYGDTEIKSSTGC
ncbi:MAG: peptidoglycan DD-metalloendopeptidase family protein [Pseudonocardiaceae bacterium]|nr:peptidoglycan DD-metalloendopeptidase family protein [Pseudonocardiaceae bacterium]